jgi:hypothetical protein
MRGRALVREWGRKEEVRESESEAVYVYKFRDQPFLILTASVALTQTPRVRSFLST